MIRIKTITTIAIGFTLIAPMAAAGDPVRIPITFTASEYNRAGSEYYDRPTFIYLEEKKKSDRLEIFTDFIRKGPIAEFNNGSDKLTFSEKRIDKYVAAIDKYISWRELALKDGDIFTKKIGKVKGKSSTFNEFSFHSGNSQNHYLIINSPHFTWADALSAPTTDARYTPESPDFVFDYENALGLKNMLLSWKAGEYEDLLQLDVDAKYQ